MIVTVDINVLLDVFLLRHPHYSASAQIVSAVAKGILTGIFPGHGITTLYYLARKQAGKIKAEAAVDMILRHFQVVSPNDAGWHNARHLPMPDFEDAVVASVADSTRSTYIMTRNQPHFLGSPVPAISPLDFLAQYTLC